VRWVVSHRWQDWRNEVVWMSLYFSVAVWISIALVHSPVPEVHIAAGERRSRLAGWGRLPPETASTG
jgi:hypothetical protein